MEQFTTFASSLSALKWQDWSTIISLIIAVFSLKAYFQQKKSSKEQSAIIDFVNRNLDKDISGEKLSKLHDKCSILESQIKDDLPNLARIAVLKEQADFNAKAIAHHYNEWNQIVNELKNHPIEFKIDKEIEKTIIDKIIPKDQLNQIQYKILILCIALIIIPQLLFYPLSLLSKVLFVTIIVCETINYYKLKRVSKNFINYVASFILASFYGMIALLFFIGILKYFFDKSTIASAITCTIFILISALGAACTPKLRKSIKPLLLKIFIT